MLTRARIAVAVALSALPVLASCTQTANVDDAYMALDSQGDRKRTAFFTDSVQIFCVAQYAASRPDVTLKMLIRQTSSLDSTGASTPTSAIVIVQEFPGPTTLTLDSVELVHADATGQPNPAYPYPPGGFQCEVYLDGVLQKTVPFTIAFAQCPDQEIIEGTPCGGFYQPSVTCPAYGESSTDPTRFECNAVPVSEDNPFGYSWGPVE